MVTIDTLEGVIDDKVSFHYDIGNDVLYLRVEEAMKVPAIGGYTDEGDILLLDEKTDRLIGITVVSWWKRFGQGKLPDSISEIAQRIEPLANRVAA